MIMAAYTQLRVAHGRIGDQRLPCEQRQPRDRLTPHHDSVGAAPSPDRWRERALRRIGSHPGRLVSSSHAYLSHSPERLRC